MITTTITMLIIVAFITIKSSSLSSSPSLFPRFFRTVMAYNSTTDLTQDFNVECFLSFSSPLLVYNGVAADTALHGKARIIRENMARVI